jgi:hypothetical protein
MAGERVELLVHIDGAETAGIDWIADDRKTVLLRRALEFEPALRGVTNAFAPWNRMSLPAPA